MIQVRSKRTVVTLLSLSTCLGCASTVNREQMSVVPAEQYAERFKGQDRPQILREGEYRQRQNSAGDLEGNSRARLRYVKDWPQEGQKEVPAKNSDVVSNEEGMSPGEVQIYPSTLPDSRPYQGPLALGNPGVSASLWQESRRGNNLFRDERAWQPLDLVTIVVQENSEGTKEADTEVKQESTILHAISNLLGFEQDVLKSNTPLAGGSSRIDLSSLINSSSSNETKGEGDTTRKGTLKATISAMVVEVLPGNVLRVEGEKIISVNAEEQVMVISGLVRPRDISSANEVQSGKIANLRIDFYGNGVVGEAQNGGWLSRFIRVVWPF